MGTAPVPCPCGGRLSQRHHAAYSTDSSFDYVGCDACDVALLNHDKLDEAAVVRWNFLFGRKHADGI